MLSEKFVCDFLNASGYDENSEKIEKGKYKPKLSEDELIRQSEIIKDYSIGSMLRAIFDPIFIIPEALKGLFVGMLFFILLPFLIIKSVVKRWREARILFVLLKHRKELKALLEQNG
ncbi:hypothetical protein [Helicobacter labetoulli]|uniref:hypothetical protein n=1 Tax=Helicobacter labetoulli TaxID=2315333 RepID=UPI000EF6DB9A|nr:hypothetical protein [Helicobacter labetoulli]